jgi:hypothetical protein
MQAGHGVAPQLVDVVGVAEGASRVVVVGGDGDAPVARASRAVRTEASGSWCTGSTPTRMGAVMSNSLVERMLALGEPGL